MARTLGGRTDKVAQVDLGVACGRSAPAGLSVGGAEVLVTGLPPFCKENAMSVHIDCDTCLVRGLACHDCVVTVLLGPPPELGFDAEEARALEALAGSGLVPPLRMVTPVSGPDIESA